MVKKSDIHSYSEKLAFERLMILIATLVQYPGIGSADPLEKDSSKHHNALEDVRDKLRQVAQDCGIQLPDGYPATSTIRKDLEILRRYGVLDRRIYRWGYYLGTGAMTIDELKVAFNALASVAKYQGDSQVRRIHATLTKRLRTLDLDSKGDFFYPVRQQLNRAVVHTDPEEMMDKGENRDNLFHQLDVVEQAIRTGSAIEISRRSDPYGNGQIGLKQVWPLQLIYHDIAWYLIFEECDNQLLAVGRINRFKNYCKVLSFKMRSLQQQYQRLLDAHKLLEKGWGLFLGKAEEQSLELDSKINLIKVKVRFFPKVIDFILEGEKRHPTQELKPGPIDSLTGKLAYVDYIVELPPRSLQEFSWWVCRHMENAEVLEPDFLRQQHYQAALALVARYQ